MNDMPEKPILIELGDDVPKLDPAEVSSVPDNDFMPEGLAMKSATGFIARPRSLLSRWFWRLLLAVIVFIFSVAVWDFLTGLLLRNSVLGVVAMVLIGLLCLVCFAILVREWAALARLGRVEGLHSEALGVISDGDLKGATVLTGKLTKLYAGREDMRWGLDRFADGQGQAFDADAHLAFAENVLLKPLDETALQEIEKAARQVATVTALVPLAFADVLAALTANVRMIRKIAEIYGGRSGTVGAWRLTRTVITHLVATGAVSIGDDLIGSLGGGHLLGRISRRFGEGLVNGALTARVGVAAIEVCRPLPFIVAKRPSVSALVRRALTGLFSRED